MANTSALQEAIQWVRDDLERQFGSVFAKSRVQLRTGGSRTFNAVAADGLVVASVMNASGATSGGKKPVGKIRGAVAELYYLSLVDAPHRLLVVTSSDFLKYLDREMDGALAEGLQIVHVKLPARLAQAVAEVREAASEEMR